MMVTLYASPYGARTRKLVAAGNVNAQGKWYPSYAITKETLFTVVFGGDFHNAGNSSHIMLQAFARVAEVKRRTALQVLRDEGAGRLGQLLQQGLTAAGRHVPQDARHSGRGRMAE